jgi:ABC-type arginine transport system permease subunit
VIFVQTAFHAKIQGPDSTVIDSIPDLLVIYLYYFGGSSLIATVAQAKALGGSSAALPLRWAPAPSAWFRGLPF